MHWLFGSASAVYPSAPSGTVVSRLTWSARRYGAMSMYAPVPQNSTPSSGTVIMATSGAVPLWIAFRTSVSSLPGTVFTWIQGYFCSNIRIVVLKLPNSGLVKPVHTHNVTGLCEPTGEGAPPDEPHGAEPPPPPP